MARRLKSFPDLAAWLPAARTRITDHLARFVRFLAADRPPAGPEAWASSLPVVSAGVPVLVTAHHVLTRLQGRRLLLEVPGRFQPIPLDGEVAHSIQADVAAIRLPATAFGWGIEFVDLDVQFEPQMTEADVEVFIAMGFPVRETYVGRQLGNLNLNLVDYWSFEATGLYQKLQLDPRSWLLVRFSRRRAYRSGLQQAMKLPHGMSGGGLWRFWGPPTEFPSLSRGALAGMLVEFREGHGASLTAARLGVVQAVVQELLRGA